MDLPYVGDRYLIDGSEVKVVAVKVVTKGHRVYAERDGEPADSWPLGVFRRKAKRVEG